MASLLTDPLFEISGRGPSPDTTFYHFSVSKSEVSIDILDYACHCSAPLITVYGARDGSLVVATSANGVLVSSVRPR